MKLLRWIVLRPAAFALIGLTVGALVVFALGGIALMLSGTSQGYAYVVFLAILMLIWILASFRYVRPWSLTVRQLSAAKISARKIALSLPSGDGDPGAQTNGLITQGTSIQEWKSWFRDNTTLGNLWRQFLDTVKERANGTGWGWPVPVAGDFLTLDEVLDNRRSKLPNALAGVFTATGLLGTFVGIAIGLMGIDLGADSSQRLDAIDELVRGMSTAFHTSIIGIALSITWLVFWRYLDRRLETNLDVFIQEVEKLIPVEDPYALVGRAVTSVERLDEIAEAAKGIKASVQSLGDDLSGAFEEHLRKHVAEPIKSLDVKLENRQVEVLESMVASFQNSLSAAVDKNANAFAKALRTATDHQVDAAKRLKRFFDRLDQVADTQTSLLTRTKEVAETFGFGLSRLVEAQEAIERAGAIAERIMADAEKLFEAQQESAKTQAEMVERLERDLGDLTSNLSEKVQEFRLLSAEKIGEVFHAFDSELAKVTDHLGGTMHELRDVAEVLLQNTQELPEAVKALDETTTGAVGALDRAIREASESGAAQQRSVESATQNFDAASERLGERLEEGLDKVREVFGTLPVLAGTVDDSSRRVAGEIEKLDVRLASLAGRAEQLGIQVSDELGDTQSRLRSVAKTLLRIPQELPHAVEQLRKATGEAAATLDQAASKLAQSGTAQQESLRSGAQLFDQASKRMGEGLEEGLGRVREAFDALPDLTQQVNTGNKEVVGAIKQLGGRLDSLARKAREFEGQVLLALQEIAAAGRNGSSRKTEARRSATGSPRPAEGDDSARESSSEKGRRRSWWRRG